ncbi:hypothetical protein CDL15_Pgr002189 [Punica granatum]|uniref:GTD-binding domain-containing protein n=1 Tax=Punica granatum TaxID=22663 RepID=A0A218XCG6_PUNGR|nr:hypothetical protein CDL15_Pgr002189 [Punica granatum]
MESEALIVAKDLVPCCSCGCSCCSDSYSSPGTWLRSVKRKYDEFESGGRFFIPGLDYTDVVKVQVENEIIALREMVSNQQQTIQDLCADLEEERNAASSAANEAMSMILRLQREKAEVQMEARQFKRFAEEKMGHDQQELAALEDLLYKREQTIQSFTCEVQAYKHRMMSYGLTEAEAEGERSQGHSRNPSMVDNFDDQFDYEYPPLRCKMNENPDPLEVESDAADVEKYAFGETPRGRELKSLEYRICQMERNPSSNQMNGDFSAPKNILEKVVVGQSPHHGRHSRKFSVDSSNSFLGMGGDAGSELVKDSPRANISIKKMDYVSHTDNYTKPGVLSSESELGDDGVDRVCTIDSVHNGAPGVGASEDYIKTPGGSLNQVDCGDPDIQKLYMRLQALEADRESMRQAIVSMRTDKAQLILLKEIAQRLCTDISSERRVPAKKPSLVGAFSFMSVFKVSIWVITGQCGSADVSGQETPHKAMEMCYQLATPEVVPATGGI